MQLSLLLDQLDDDIAAAKKAPLLLKADKVEKAVDSMRELLAALVNQTEGTQNHGK